MSIDAYNKFINTILNRLEDYKLKSSREITDVTELEKILEKGTGHGYSLGVIESIYKFENASAKEYVYDNGLIYLDSEINYRDNICDNLHTIRQLTLTTNYQQAPLVNIVVQKERKAMQQLLIKSDSKDEIFPESMKDIEIQQTSIHVDNHCGSAFTTYTNLTDGCLMLEQYMQYYPVSNYEDSEKDLIRLCGYGTRYLEIIYRKSEPIFAQLSDKYKVEMAGFDPNSALDAKTIVEKINLEVSEILNKINRLIDEYQKGAKSLIKTK